MAWRRFLSARVKTFPGALVFNLLVDLAEFAAEDAFFFSVRRSLLTLQVSLGG